MSAHSQTPTVVAHGNGHACDRGPAFITEQEVVFGTAAARAPRANIGHRLLRVFAWATHFSPPHRSLPHLPPPRVHYPRVGDYLEPARMAREMARL